MTVKIDVGFPISSDVSLQKAQPLQSLDSIFRLDYVNIWIMSSFMPYSLYHIKSVLVLLHNNMTKYRILKRALTVLMLL